MSHISPILTGENVEIVRLNVMIEVRTSVSSFCVLVYDGFVISFIYQKNKNKKKEGVVVVKPWANPFVGMG